MSQAIYLRVSLVVNELIALEELYFYNILRLDQVVETLHDLLLVLHHIIQLFGRVVNYLLHLLDIFFCLLQFLAQVRKPVGRSNCLKVVDVIVSRVVWLLRCRSCRVTPESSVSAGCRLKLRLVERVLELLVPHNLALIVLQLGHLSLRLVLVEAA